MTRKTAQLVIPKMHIQGWIFDIEMLIICQRLNIPIKEVAVSWQEVDGTKLSIIRDSVKMLFHLIVIRLNYFFGIWE
jgi:dolichyl-phosphate beta-glucosyltransferase